MKICCSPGYLSNGTGRSVMLKSSQAASICSPSLSSAKLSISCVNWCEASRCNAQKLWDAVCCSKQQRSYFLPLPQGQGSFLPTLPFPRGSIMSALYRLECGKARAAKSMRCGFPAKQDARCSNSSLDEEVEEERTKQGGFCHGRADRLPVIRTRVRKRRGSRKLVRLLRGTSDQLVQSRKQKL
jgi:hypothetical protein